MESDSCLNMIIITIGPISSFHYHTTYWADYLTLNKIKFKIYDCLPLMAKYNYPASFVQDQLDDSESVNIEKIISYSYLESLLKELDKENTLIVIYPGYEYLTFRIYRLISKYNLRYCAYNANAFPNPKKVNNPEYTELRQKISMGAIISALAKCRSIKDIEHVGADIFPHIPKKLLGINFANYILQAGTDSLYYNFRFPVDKSTKNVWGHFRDYDQYLKSLETPINVKENQVVYVSTNLFNDVVLNKYPAYVAIMNPKLYYNSLKKLFHMLERKGYNIIVTAHPREPLSELKQYLNEWEVTLGDTDTLIRESKFSIQIASASTTMSLLYERPFIMITSDSIIDTKEIYYDGLVDMSNNFGKKLLNIDHLTENLKLEWYLYANPISVEKFMSSRVKIPNSPKLPLCQILINNL